MKSRKQASQENYTTGHPPVPWEQLRRAAVLCLWVLLILLCLRYREYITIDRIVSYTPEEPLLAALVLLGLFALKSVTLFIYSGILYAASGVLFELPFAVLVNLAGSFLMVSIPYFIGRRAGRRALAAMVEKNGKLRLLRDAMNTNAFFLSFFLRILGLLPSDLVGMYLGASGLSYPHYVLGSLLGLLPTTITFALMGMSADDIGSPAFLISAGIELAMMLVSALVYYLWQGRLKKKQRKP